MIYLTVCSVALVASGLTFFSGFGLGTLLLPAFALFFPVALAVAMTAVVHFLTGLFNSSADLGHVRNLKALMEDGVPPPFSGG